MKHQAAQTVERRKIMIIAVLYISSVAIVVVGISFGIFSLLNGVQYSVLNSSVPGAVFGLVVAFLGVRYFLSVRKLKKEVYKSTSVFSWSNFKRK